MNKSPSASSNGSRVAVEEVNIHFSNLDNLFKKKILRIKVLKGMFFIQLVFHAIILKVILVEHSTDEEDEETKALNPNPA